MNPTRHCILVLLLLAAVSSAFAQDLPRPTVLSRRTDFTTEGREFWLVFQKNFRDFMNSQTLGGRSPSS